LCVTRARAAACLPRLVLSDELPLAARRMACDVLRNATLTGAPPSLCA
jgi:hypothetical protein